MIGSATARPSSSPTRRITRRSARPSSANGRPRSLNSTSATPRSSAFSVDKVGDHEGWSQDIKDVSGNDVTFPMIGDHDLKVAKLYNMLPADADETPRAAPPRTTRRFAPSTSSGPDKKIKAMLIYPMSSGRNFEEILRLLDSIQLTAKHPVATPVNWNRGEDVHHRAVAERRRRRKKLSRRLEDREALPAHDPAAAGSAGNEPAE